MSIPFHDEQLRFMVELSAYRADFWDAFFRFLNYFDSSYFLWFLIPILWIGLSYRWGIRIFYLMLVSALVNGFLKFLVDWPRPSTECPEIGLFHFKSGGFPSGAAQTALLLAGLLIYKVRSKAALVMGLLYIAIISFSRLYLGVHYPIDILGGWAVGACLLFLFVRFLAPIEKFLCSKTLFFRFALSGVPFLFILRVYDGTSLNWVAAAAIGTAIGLFFSLQNGLYLPDSKTGMEALKRSAFAVSGVILFLLLGARNSSASAQFALSLWISLIGSPVYRKINSRH